MRREGKEKLEGGVKVSKSTKGRAMGGGGGYSNRRIEKIKGQDRKDSEVKDRWGKTGKGQME